MKSSERIREVEDAIQYLDALKIHLKSAVYPAKLAKHYSRLEDEVQTILENLTFGAITWEMLGNNLQNELDRLHSQAVQPSEGTEVIIKLIHNFLAELDRRKLLQSKLTAGM